MQDDIAIKVRDLKKSFRLPHERSNSLKSLLINMGRGQGYETQQVLDGVSFDIHKGEFYGIVGRNGSGKSTLLKLLAGIYTQDSGEITLNGKLTPFIELGVGFNPELSGRENVYLNGALLGYSRKEMDVMYDDIVSFAELERFMDQKLKNYSSGMQVRLAFSIAIKSRSEILIFDEVLAVGDERFQKKCLEVFRQFKKERRTVVLVTHDMGNVERFCDRALVMTEDQKYVIAKPDEASAIYSRMNVDEKKLVRQDETSEKQAVRSGTGQITVSDIALLKDDKRAKIFDMHQALTMRFTLKRTAGFEKAPVLLGLAIINEDGVTVCGPNSMSLVETATAQTLEFTLPSVSLKPGDYSVTVVLFEPATMERLDYLEQWVHFSVVSDHPVAGLVEVENNWKVIK